MTPNRTPLSAADQIAYTAVNAEIEKQIQDHQASGLTIAFSPNTPITTTMEKALISWWQHQGWTLSIHRGGLADTILLQAANPAH